MDKKALALIGGALLLIGMVVGMEMFSWSPKPERRGAVLPGPGPYGGGTEPLSAKRRRITFRDLLGLMVAKASNPTTREFAEEFQRTQSLRTAWEDFRDSDDTEAFVQTLQDDPAFNALAEKYGGTEEFRDAAETLANEPGMEEIVRKLMSERRPVVVVRKEEPLPKESPARAVTEKPVAVGAALEKTRSAQKTSRDMRPVSGKVSTPVQGALKKQPTRYESPGGAYNDKLDPIPLINGKPISLERLGIDPALQQQLQQQIPQAPQAPQGGSEPFNSLRGGAEQSRSPSAAPSRSPDRSTR